MKQLIRKNPHELLKIKYNGAPANLPSQFCLLADDYFDLGLGYYENQKLVKDVYFPLSCGQNFKEQWVLIELIGKSDSILARKKLQNQVTASYLKTQDLSYYIKKNAAHYTTLSVEDSFLNQGFETTLPNGFSLIHFCHETAKGGGKIRSIAIIADPGSTLNHSYQEGQALYEFFKTLNLPLKINFITTALYQKDFEDILSQNSLVHFSGHCEPKGLWLGKEFYTPFFSQQPVAPLIFLNTCTLPVEILKGFIIRNSGNLVYCSKDQKDSVADLEKIQYFYLGLLLGYRIGDASMKTLDFKKHRLYGWMTNRFTLSPL